jgi:hypothetical protein
MMAPVVIATVAIAIMLVAAVAVGVLRLLGAVRRLTAAADGTRKQLEPIVTELQENSEITGLESAQLQASLESLRARRNGQR